MTILACIFLALFLIAHLIGIVVNLLFLPDNDYFSSKPFWLNITAVLLWELTWITILLIYLACFASDWRMTKWLVNSRIKCRGQFVATVGEKNCICNCCGSEAPADLIDYCNRTEHETESPEWIKFQKTIRFRFAYFFLHNFG